MVTITTKAFSTVFLMVLCAMGSAACTGGVATTAGDAASEPAGSQTQAPEAFLADPGGGEYYLTAYDVHVPTCSTVVKIPQNVGVVGVWVSASLDSSPLPAPQVFFNISSTTEGFSFALDKSEPVEIPVLPEAITMQMTNFDPDHEVDVSILWVVSH